VHPLWFYKHQHDNRVRSKLFVACQRWWFQWRFAAMLVDCAPSGEMHNYCTPHIIKENVENFLIHRCNCILLSQVYCVWQVVETPTIIFIFNNPVYVKSNNPKIKRRIFYGVQLFIPVLLPRTPRSLRLGHAKRLMSWVRLYHLPSTRAGIKNEWSYTSTPPICLQILDTGCVNWIDLAQDSVVAAFFRTCSKPTSRCTSTPAQAVTVSSLWCDGQIPTTHRTSP
jgi:hypothetical protein